MNFDDIAVELRIAAERHPQGFMNAMTFAVWMEASSAAKNARHMEVLAARIGLPAPVARGVIVNWDHHAQRLAEAHTLIKSLAPDQAEIARLIARPRETIAPLDFRAAR